MVNVVWLRVDELCSKVYGRITPLNVTKEIVCVIGTISWLLNQPWRENCSWGNGNKKALRHLSSYGKRQ